MAGGSCSCGICDRSHAAANSSSSSDGCGGCGGGGASGREQAEGGRVHHQGAGEGRGGCAGRRGRGGVWGARAVATAAAAAAAGGDRTEGWLSESEESAHTEEAASEAASEAGESTDASTGLSVAEDPTEVEGTEEPDTDAGCLVAKNPPCDPIGRGRPRMRLPSPPPPTPAELEARWGSRCDSGSDGESLVDDRDRDRAKIPGLPAAAKKLLSQ
mmetsp:Transcript_22662/g.53577  ORF Transcript_22662/g.53577 Transcript_22662/m.53577 type:complete len:215 (+) Transcript_22662:478-1122(+)